MDKSLELMEEINFYKNQIDMDNKVKYSKIFMESFEIGEEVLANLKYQSIETWDSVGHMVLIAALEEGFDIIIDMDDIIDFNGFESGKAILAKYDVIVG